MLKISINKLYFLLYLPTLFQRYINITPYISTSNQEDSTKPLSYDFFGFNYKKISSNKLTTLSWAAHINPDAKEDFDSLNFYINNGCTISNQKP